MILKSAAPQLSGKRLALVSDGILQYIPFAALPAPSLVETRFIASDTPVPLIAEHEIVNLPSASALAIMRRDTEKRQPAPKTLAVIADPVFGTDDERVRGIVPSGSLPVPRATAASCRCRCRYCLSAPFYTHISATDSFPCTRNTASAGIRFGRQSLYSNFLRTQSGSQACISPLTVSPTVRNLNFRELCCLCFEKRAICQTATCV